MHHQNINSPTARFCIVLEWCSHKMFINVGIRWWVDGGIIFPSWMDPHHAMTGRCVAPTSTGGYVLRYVLWCGTVLLPTLTYWTTMASGLYIWFWKYILMRLEQHSNQHLLMLGVLRGWVALSWVLMNVCACWLPNTMVRKKPIGRHIETYVRILLAACDNIMFLLIVWCAHAILGWQNKKKFCLK